MANYQLNLSLPAVPSPQLSFSSCFKREPLRINGASIYRPRALPVTKSTTSKHWRELKALIPTSTNHPLAPHFLYTPPPEGKRCPSPFMLPLQGSSNLENGLWHPSVDMDDFATTYLDLRRPPFNLQNYQVISKGSSEYSQSVISW